MTDARTEPQRIAALVADGQAPDWDEARRAAADDHQRKIIDQLRVVDTLSRVLRDPGYASAGLPLRPEVGAESSPSVPASRPWGHLELRERLGEGGFAEVYRAWDPRLEREVALKLLKNRGPGEPSSATGTIAEGRLLAKLRHPNVVVVHGAEVHDGRVGLWMELVRGRSLERLLREQGPFGAREAAMIGIDLCRALAAVHGAGLVHRDVKAQNVMREEGGRILLTDFGAGVDLRTARQEDTGRITGTPLYMAPELFREQAASPRSDIYSLGVLLYRLVTGSFPIQASSWPELEERHLKQEALLLRDQRPDLPEGFVAVVERATAWDPQLRFATPGEMQQALSHAFGTGLGPAAVRGGDSAAHAPARRRSKALWLASAAGLVAVLVSLYLFGPGPFGRRDAPVEPAAPSPATPPASDSYSVEAAVYRAPAGSSTRDRLEAGARLALGDRVTLEVEASKPLYVYVINEDEAGHSYSLFPLPGLDEQNPLQPGTRHVLPGRREGRSQAWTVDSPGGREHLLVLASPKRLVEFEAEMSALAQPGLTAVPMSDAAKIHLRGLGSLSESPPPAGGASAGRLFEMAQQLASSSEVVNGVWMRRFDLENPPR